MKDKAKKELENIFNLSSDMICVCTPEGKFTKVNPACERVLGYTNDELLNLGWAKLVHPDDAEKTHKEVEKQLKGNSVSNFINRFICKDGTYKTLEWNAVPSENSMLYATARDITERKKAGEELQKAKNELEKRVNERTAELSSTVELLQKEITEHKKTEEEILLHSAIVKNMAEGVCLVRTSDAVIVYANEKFEKMFGYDPGELNGKPVALVNYEDDNKDAEKVRDEIIEQLTQYGEAMYEIRNVKKDGTPFWCLAHTSTITYSAYGNVWVAVHSDITESKKIEDALRKKEEQYRNIVETSVEGIWIIDKQGNTSFVNNQMAKLLGYTVDEMINRNFFEFMDEEAKNEAKSKLERRKKGITERHDFRFKKKDGSDLWTIVSTNPIKNDKGEFIGALGMITDITDRKQAEEQISKSLEEKEVLLQEIHHRVKNNMTVIMSLLKLQADRVKDKHYREMLGDSMGRIKTMALIHEKLYKAKDLAKVDFNDYLKDMINSMFMSYGLSSHKVALKTDVEDVAFGIDTAIPCGLIINELVSNSLKYAFPEAREGEIKVSLRRNDKAEVELTVSDNGVGMPEDVDFRKTDSLGLNLVNTLVGQLQGKIELYREKGTEFIITFKGITV